VHVYGYWTERGQLYLTMEYVNGWSLKQILDRLAAPAGEGGEPRMPLRLPVWAVCALVRPLLDALVRVHQVGYVHRDLKPGNIMVNTEGQPKLLDFGIVRKTDQEMTLPGTIIGTTAYMSPEQTEGRNATAQSDLFALGIIAFELLTGKHPFRCETAEKTAEAIRSRKITPADFPDRVPQGLRKFVCALLQKDPKKRPNTYQALLALDTVMEGLPRDLDYPLSQWLRSIRKNLPLPLEPEWKHRLPGAVPLLIATCVGCALGLASRFWF
jgi:serine/threonine-protein kinase